MLKFLIICGVGILVVFGGAPVEGRQDFQRLFGGGTHRSLSGQFVVLEPPVTDNYPYYPASASNYVRLDPTLLAVSCERIKHAVLAELDARDQWRGKIYFDLHHTRSLDENILVNPILLGNQWTYRVSLPDFLERSRVVTVVVQTVMMEIANRNGTTSAEIPVWLAEGMTRQVMRASQLELVLEPPRNTENGVTLQRENREIQSVRVQRDGALGVPVNLGNVPNADPIAQTVDTLRVIPPLSLDELSWPREGQFAGQDGEAYRCSAQLLVHELLQLRDGRAAMQALLPELSRHLNWQISFLTAFHGDFANQLELSKWWALRLVQLTGRDVLQTWSVEESRERLDEVLHPSVQIRASSRDLPERSRVSLQTAIRDLDLPSQKMLFPETLRQLSEVRLRVAGSLVNLVDDYRRVLGGYLFQRDRGVAFPLGKGSNGSQLDGVARDVIRELDGLDQLRKLSGNRGAVAGQPVAINSNANH